MDGDNGRDSGQWGASGEMGAGGDDGGWGSDGGWGTWVTSKILAFAERMASLVCIRSVQRTPALRKNQMEAGHAQSEDGCLQGWRLVQL